MSPIDSIYGSAAQLMLSESISQNIRDASGWKKVLYWKSARGNTAPGVFKQGNEGLHTIPYCKIRNFCVYGIYFGAKFINLLI